jgi:hypothetical protein
VLGPFLVLLLLVTALSAGQATDTFTGVITDDVCAKEGHAGMRMGPTDAECTKLCVTLHDGRFVLLVGKDAYELSDQQLPEKFAAQKVSVTGRLDAGTRVIQVESIVAAD